MDQIVLNQRAKVYGIVKFILEMPAVAEELDYIPLERVERREAYRMLQGN